MCKTCYDYRYTYRKSYSYRSACLESFKGNISEPVVEKYERIPCPECTIGPYSPDEEYYYLGVYLGKITLKEYWEIAKEVIERADNKNL